MFDELLPLARHLRIELERLEANIRFDKAARPPQCLFKALEADDTPGAGNVGNKVDLQGHGHDGISARYRNVT
jgi:hypothetical protein